MKIICDSCGAKYSIADEKVKGKVFKIRCKKCSHIIVVRGEDEPAYAEGGYDGGAGGGGGYDSPVWHVVIDREQVGPMTAVEVRDRFAAGDINADTYIWREGFSDWVRLSTVEEFADVAQATSVAPAAAEAAPAAADGGWGADPGGGADAWGAGADAGGGVGGDLFGAADAQAAQAAHDPGVFSSTPDEPAGADDMFSAAGGGAAAAGGQQLFPDESEPMGGGLGGGGGDAQMTGQRGENSVLFSLSNLQQLAMGGGAPGAAPAGIAAKPAAKSNGSPESGSGLIDIRAMASASTVAPTSMPSSGHDDLPVLGGFAAPVAAAPVLMPAPEEEKPKWILPVLLGGGGLMLVAIIVLAVMVLKKDPPKTDSTLAANTAGATGAAAGTPGAGGAVNNAAGGAAATKGGAATKAGGATAGTANGTGAAAAAGSAAGSGSAAEKPGGDSAGKAHASRTRRHTRRRGSSRRGRSGRKRSGGSSRRVAALSTPAAKPTRRRSGKKDSLDALIDGALGGGKKKRAPAARRAAPAANLPKTLSRSQIQGGMRRIKGRVRGCYDRFKVPGLASAKVKIGQRGRVTSVRIKGIFAGTPTGACVAAAVRSARFPKFGGSPIGITYPFILR